MKKDTKWMLGITVALGVIAGFVAYTFLQERKKPEQPPANAPQLDLDNPGSQAEFPTAATDSELG